MTLRCKTHGTLVDVDAAGNRTVRVTLGAPAPGGVGGVAPRCALALARRPAPGTLTAGGHGPCEVVSS